MAPYHVMKTVSKLRKILFQGAPALLLLTVLTGCEMPPRETWRIIQRDGLLTYWDREYHPHIAPSRYLQTTGQPLVPRRGQVLTGSVENRYLASGPVVPYRAQARREPAPSPLVIQPQVTRQPRIAQAPEPKVLTEPYRDTRPRTKSTPTPSAPAAAARPMMDSLPYGTPVPGRPGMVNSPFAGQQQLVDVTGMAAGEAVKDPYSGKLFRVPPLQEAAAVKTESVPELPAAADKPVEEGKTKP